MGRIIFIYTLISSSLQLFFCAFVLAQSHFSKPDIQNVSLPFRHPTIHNLPEAHDNGWESVAHTCLRAALFFYAFCHAHFSSSLFLRSDNQAYIYTHQQGARLSFLLTLWPIKRQQLPTANRCWKTICPDLLQKLRLGRTLTPPYFLFYDCVFPPAGEEELSLPAQGLFQKSISKAKDGKGFVLSLLWPESRQAVKRNYSQLCRECSRVMS